MFDNFVSALGDRFRRQYPQGSIISDLVQIHGDQYVVKVSVSLANTVLVSTLAADANLMLAENRAMERALTILGIRDSQQPAHEPVNLTVTPLPDLPKGLTNSVEQPKAAVASELLPNGATSLPEPLVTPVITNLETTAAPVIIQETSLPAVPAVPAAEPIRIQVGVASEISEQPMKFDIIPSFSEPDAEITMPTTNGQVIPEPPIESVSASEVPVAKSSRTKKAVTTPDPLPTVTVDEASLDETTVPITSGATCEHVWSEATSDPCVAGREAIAEPPLSVTDMIPMINMELKRLGWSKDRGRDYMVSLYNKRASALLSDDELFGLLKHLQAEPVV
jgi:hypothetical protein